VLREDEARALRKRVKDEERRRVSRAKKKKKKGVRHFAVRRHDRACGAEANPNARYYAGSKGQQQGTISDKKKKKLQYEKGMLWYCKHAHSGACGWQLCFERVEVMRSQTEGTRPTLGVAGDKQEPTQDTGRQQVA